GGVGRRGLVEEAALVNVGRVLAVHPVLVLIQLVAGEVGDGRLDLDGVTAARVGGGGGEGDREDVVVDVVQVVDAGDRHGAAGPGQADVGRREGRRVDPLVEGDGDRRLAGGGTDVGDVRPDQVGGDREDAAALGGGCEGLQVLVEGEPDHGDVGQA